MKKFVLVLSIVGVIFSCDKYSVEINQPFINKIEQFVQVKASPTFDYNYDYLTEGTIQHIDRTYTYDYIPKEIEEGILFQGIHRTPINTELEIELKVPAKVYFFFHINYDGGLNESLKLDPNWKRCDDAPKYDVFNGDHGKNMIMYVLDGEIGTYTLGTTTRDKACFNIVFKGIENALKRKN